MTNPNYTDITFVLDRSGSMSGSELDLIGGVNKYLEEQRTVAGKCSITTVLFDDVYEVLYNGVDLHEVRDLDRSQYNVRGMTALFDALGRAIEEAGRRFRAMPESERPGRVLFVVITDGHENSSKEFNLKRLADMVKTQQDTYDWDFVFIGADLDAFGAYSQVGVRAANYTSVGKGDLENELTTFAGNSKLYRSVDVACKGGVNLTADMGK